MNLAIVCPVGPLDRYGYQHVYQECIASMCDCANLVVLVGSTRKNKEMGELGYAHGNLIRLSNELTWFDLVDSEEYFDIQKVDMNIDFGLEYATYHCDIALVMEVNQYIPPAARVPLRLRCEQVLQSGEPYGWYYRRDFLAGQMFHANLRRPWIVALPSRVKFVPDGIMLDGEPVKLPHVRGNWPEEDEAAIVDAQLEFTPQDFEEKYNFIRCYADLEPSRSPVFDWNVWFPYMVNKFRKKTMGGELDPIGRRLLGRMQPDFVSRMVLEELRK